MADEGGLNTALDTLRDAVDRLRDGVQALVAKIADIPDIDLSDEIQRINDLVAELQGIGDQIEGAIGAPGDGGVVTEEPPAGEPSA